jgi:hypothetical protein
MSFLQTFVLGSFLMPIVRRKKTGGRMTDQVFQAYVKHYKLTPKQGQLLTKIIVQVALCKDEEARRLLLGVSE